MAVVALNCKTVPVSGLSGAAGADDQAVDGVVTITLGLHAEWPPEPEGQRLLRAYLGGT
jgi:hypothetical protein